MRQDHGQIVHGGKSFEWAEKRWRWGLANSLYHLLWRWVRPFVLWERPSLDPLSAKSIIQLSIRTCLTYYHNYWEDIIPELQHLWQRLQECQRRKQFVGKWTQASSWHHLKRRRRGVRRWVARLSLLDRLEWSLTAPMHRTPALIYANANVNTQP